MDLKRIFRSWMLVILLVFVLLVVVLKFTGSNQYRVVPTSQVMALVQNDKVRSATLTVPTQVVQVTTKDGRNLGANRGVARRSKQNPLDERLRADFFGGVGEPFG